MPDRARSLCFDQRQRDGRPFESDSYQPYYIAYFTCHRDGSRAQGAPSAEALGAVATDAGEGLYLVSNDRLTAYRVSD